MPLAAIFTRRQPSIGGIIFDATLEETDELKTDVSRYSIESGIEGNDHAVTRNQTFSLTVGISDNIAKSLTADASQGAVLNNLNRMGLSSGAMQTIIGGATATGIGAAVSGLSGSVSALAGVGASIANASYAAGQAATRSATVLESIRSLQRSKSIFTLSTSKGTYDNCLITRTRRQTTPENTQGLELVVEIEQMRIMSTQRTIVGIKPQNDTAETQAYPMQDYGRISATPL